MDHSGAGLSAFERHRPQPLCPEGPRTGSGTGDLQACPIRTSAALWAVRAVSAAERGNPPPQHGPPIQTRLRPWPLHSRGAPPRSRPLHRHHLSRCSRPDRCRLLRRLLSLRRTARRRPDGLPVRALQQLGAAGNGPRRIRRRRRIGCGQQFRLRQHPRAQRRCPATTAWCRRLAGCQRWCLRGREPRRRRRKLPPLPPTRHRAGSGPAEPYIRRGGPGGMPQPALPAPHGGPPAPVCGGLPRNGLGLHCQGLHRPCGRECPSRMRRHCFLPG